MTQDDLFKQPDPAQIDPNADLVTELVGENKKFKTLQDLAKGKLEADSYVKSLESKLDEMRSDYLRLREDHTAGASLKELIDQMKSSGQSSSDETPDAKDVKQQQPEYKPEDIDKLIQTKMEQRELQRKEEQNLSVVMDKLKERFGHNYANVLNEQRETLGLSSEDINSLARKSPQAFFRTLGLDQPKQDGFQAPPRSNQRTDNFSPSASKRTWSYYQNLKKSNPKLYYDPKTIAQQHRDYQELGSAFEDGDFNA